MKALILETSAEKSLIALSIDGEPIAVQALSGGPQLSKNLALEVKNLLSEYSLRPDCIAVGTGPGSYTGIRVGAALAKALAFGWQIPLFGFCSLLAFSPAAAPGVSLGASQWAVLVDARMGGFYALESSQGAPRLFSLAEAEIAFRHTPVLASPHPDLIQKRLTLPGKWIETSPDPRLLSALAHKLFLKGDSPSLNLSYLSSP